MRVNKHLRLSIKLDLFQGQHCFRVALFYIHIEEVPCSRLQGIFPVRYFAYFMFARIPRSKLRGVRALMPVQEAQGIHTYLPFAS